MGSSHEFKTPKDSLCPNPTCFTVNCPSRKGLFLHSFISYTQLWVFKCPRSHKPWLSQRIHYKHTRKSPVPRTTRAGQPKGPMSNSRHLEKKEKNPHMINQPVTFPPQIHFYPPTIYGLSHHNIGCQGSLPAPRAFQTLLSTNLCNKHKLGKYL